MQIDFSRLFIEKSINEVKQEGVKRTDRDI